MTKIVAVSRDRHAGKRWKRFVSYDFARQTPLIPLVFSELSKAAMSLPLAFVRQGENLVLAALMGFSPTQNLLVAPDGRWLGRYVPSLLRSHPFSMVKTDGDTLMLCIDEASGLVTDEPEGEPFFAADGEPAEELGRILAFLQQIERNRLATGAASAALARHELIRPWTINLKGDAGERQIEGIFQVDETAFNQLSDEAFLDLRRASALPLAYCQMLSMQHIELLSEFAKAPPKPPASLHSVRPVSNFVLREDDLLQFDWERPPAS